MRPAPRGIRPMHEHTATAMGVQGCPVCTAVLPIGTPYCARCGTHGHTLERAGMTWNGSMQRTWAWLLTSVLLYLPANFLPIMYTRTWGNLRESTILGGVLTLWGHGSYPIAIVIFVASVLVPVGKIVILVWLCLSVQLRYKSARRYKTRLYRITEFVGRWSMVDVFVVGILVALIRLGNVMTILPGPAALAFAGMVFTTMLAAGSFDPRLLWVREA
ncbi:MAG TPA: paraquat-inducible membrane protein A [Deltaproteobacteria bacterium]|nr:paraquat-inducible membrane protein A [Deltaproteobacteria bacterium]